MTCRKLPNGTFRLVGEGKRKNLGTYKSKAACKAAIRRHKMFKHMKGKR